MTTRGDEVLQTLSQRERDIAVRISQGLSNREIASQINLNEQAIKNSAKAIFDKAGVESRLQLAIFMFRHGIVQCPCGYEA